METIKYFKLFFSVCCVMMFVITCNAQVTVTGSTGANATYSTLGAAFTALNSNANQNGNNIVITISASTTETASASLTGTVSNSWSSLKIYPTNTGVVISGTINGAPLIDFAGASNITIDGRVNQTGPKDLSIINTSITSTSGTSTFRFYSDAMNNVIKYCTIKGSSMDASGGIIIFSGTARTNGNDNNIIDNNDITCSTDANRPINTIYSSGTNFRENSGIIISNNNFFNCFNRGSASSIIYLKDYNLSWTILGNSFYETNDLVPTASITYTIINVTCTNVAGTNMLISNNWIGGNSQYCGGGKFVKTNGNNNIFYGIYIKGGNTIINNVQGNVIRNIDWSNNGENNWYGIYVASGDVNIGTSAANIIGDSIGNGSITFTNGGAGGSTFYGIYFVGRLTEIRNNVIGSITTNHSSNYSVNFNGIFSNVATSTIRNNLIGSYTTNNSILASSSSSSTAQSVIGISTSGGLIYNNIISKITDRGTNSGTSANMRGIYGTTGTSTISGNIVCDLSTSNTNTGTAGFESICGIGLAVTMTYNQIITLNKVYNISNVNSSFAGSVIGIEYHTSAGISGIINNNFVYNISVNSSTANANIYGIKMHNCTSTSSNNLVLIGGNTASNIYGIYVPDYTQTTNVYFNTVYISGNPTSGANNSYAFFDVGNSNTIRNYKNNIFVNTRSNNGASGINFAISIKASTNMTINYNDYFVSGTGCALGRINGTAKTDFTAWKSGTAQDANSLSTNPLFASPRGTVPANYFPSATLNAVTGTGILIDYGENTRSTTSPIMGFMEFSNNIASVYVFSGTTLLGSFTNIRNAFDKINDGTLTGDITLEINTSQSLTSPAVLYGNGSGSANYSSLKIYPTVSGLSISGSLDAPLIDLRGVSNVTIDGRVNMSGTGRDLIIVNNSTSNTGGTSTIRFINDASNNTVKYCTIKGSSTSLCGTLQYVGANILFDTTSGTTGNDNNLIDNNNITGSNAANRPVYAIYSAGTIAKENSGNIISNNSFYNFLNIGLATLPYSSGIYIYNYNTNWTITGNKFYETTPFSPTKSQSGYAAIIVDYYQLQNQAGNNMTISNNVIGGNAEDGSGTWIKTNSVDNSFCAIQLRAGSVAASNIQGNVIKNISWSQPGNASAVFNGIFVWGGILNVTNNIIGSETGNGSITYNTGWVSPQFTGINYSNLLTTDVIDIKNNIIGSITINSSNAALATNFTGISKTSIGGATTIRDNLIGSLTTPNSINVTSASTSYAQTVYGIKSSGTQSVTISGNIISNINNGTTNSGASTSGLINGIAVTNGTNIISGNKISNLTIANANNSNTTPSVAGINLSTTNAAVQTVSGNLISNLTNTYSIFKGYVNGVYYSGPTTSSTVNGNFINSLITNSSDSAKISGIYINAGATSYYNNIISIGSNNQSIIYGIYENGVASNNNNVFYNTVYITGTPTTGALNSYALFSAASTNIRNIRNNIFFNTRTNSGTSGNHYAAYFNYGVNTNLSLNYNDYFVSGTGGILGRYNNADINSLPIITGKDTNSFNTDPLFTAVKSGGTVYSDFKPGTILTGVNESGITTDYTGFSRVIPTTLGSIEYINPMPVEMKIFKADVKGCTVKLMWITNSEINNSGFEIQRSISINFDSFDKAGFVKSNNNNNHQTEYSFTDSKLNTGKYFYRLKQIDLNGNFKYYTLQNVITIGAPIQFNLGQNYPNPFNPATKIDFQLPFDSKVSVTIYDVTGKEIKKLVNNEFKKADYYTISFNATNLSSGVYFYNITAGKYTDTKKMILIK